MLGLVAATAATLTAAVVFLVCYTGVATLALEDRAGHINLLHMLREFTPKKAALLRQWLKKIRNLLSGAVQDSTNMHIQ